jgi:hypothetical protein
MVKEPTLNLSFFCTFFEQTMQSFNFFLKLGTCTYFKSFNKNPEADSGVITKSKKHPTYGLVGRQDVVFHCSVLKQSFRVVGWCHSARKVSSFQSLFRGPLLW